MFTVFSGRATKKKDFFAASLLEQMNTNRAVYP